MKNETPITNIMMTDPVTVSVDQKLSDARRALSTERFHHLPVVDGKRLVGLISKTDLLRLDIDDAKADYADFLDEKFRISDVMQTDLITVSYRASIAEAAELLSAGGFHALPVTDQDENLRGILTSTDLIEFLLERSESDLPPEALERTRTLEAVLKAAELYLHSGLAETEHTRLEQAIEAARK